MAISPHSWSESDQKAIREQLVRILNSGPFHHAQRRQRFLEYIVNESLAGRGERLKGYNVAQAVFDRTDTFDSNVDPIVRLEAGRLRDRLREYYDGDGQDDPIRVELPKGTYTPHIEFRQAPTRDPRLDRVAPTKQLMLAAAVLLIIMLGLWGLQHWNSGPSLPDKSSVAVLPFDNIGTDPKWDRLADGMTEDIITDLSHSKDLVVIARNSTELYKGKPIDIRQIGRDLNVKYVVEGSIQSVGDQNCVTAQLVEAASGSQVWSERYERPVDDLFAVQNEVTQRIAATLGGAVAEAERRLHQAQAARQPIRLRHLLAGHRLDLGTQGDQGKLDRSRRSCIAKPSNSIRNWHAHTSAWRMVQSYLIDLGWAPSVEEARSKMMEAAEKAVQLDPGDGATHHALGVAYTYQGKWDQARAEFDRAETLAPSDADTLLNIAWVIPGFGESGRAVSLAERSLKLNPHYPYWYNQGLRTVFFYGEQYDRSVKYGLLVKEPPALDCAFLAMAYAYLGRTGDAEAAAANVKKLDPTWIAERYLIEAGGWAEKEAELFVDGARRAGLPACVPADKLKDMPNLCRVKSCDQQRAKIAGAGDHPVIRVAQRDESITKLMDGLIK